MRNLRSYYASPVTYFLQQSDKEILGIIHANDISAETTIQQGNTWEIEIQVLKEQLHGFSEGRIIFEYTISIVLPIFDDTTIAYILFQKFP